MDALVGDVTRDVYPLYFCRTVANSGNLNKVCMERVSTVTSSLIGLVISTFPTAVLLLKEAKPSNGCPKVHSFLFASFTSFIQ